MVCAHACPSSLLVHDFFAVSIADKDALNVVYAHGNHTLDKSAFYHAFASRKKPSLFSVTNRQAHAQKRRLVSNAFSYSSLQQFAPIIHQIISKFVDLMDRICEEDRPINILHHFNYYSFDILSDLSFGEPIGMIERVSTIEFKPQIHTHAPGKGI